MKPCLLKILILFTGFLLPFKSHAQKVVVLNINTEIYPATTDYIANGLKQATAQNAACVILKINTPGGFLKSARQIADNIMQSPIPVISYISPDDAQAGSVGALVALSANLTIMTPGATLGVPHQASDSDGNQKINSDAIAFIQLIAQKRGINRKLLREIVTNTRSISAKQALQNHIIDFTAPNLHSLLAQLDRKSIALNTGQNLILHTASAHIEPFEMGAKTQIRNTLNNPNVMYVLLILGIIGILFELFNPGGVTPGIVGIIALILAIYGMSLLPVNYSGLGLILLAIVLFILEIKFHSYALLSIGGIVCLLLGSSILIKKAPSFDVVTISWSVLIACVIILSAFFLLLIGAGLKAQFNKPFNSQTNLVGMAGIAMETLAPEGRVRVNGEFWNAVSESGTIPKGVKITVIQTNNFVLTVKQI